MFDVTTANNIFYCRSCEMSKKKRAIEAGTSIAQVDCKFSRFRSTSILAKEWGFVNGTTWV